MSDIRLARSTISSSGRDQFPHLTGMIAAVAHAEPEDTLGWCDDQFEFGLDLILVGLDRLAASGS